MLRRRSVSQPLLRRKRLPPPPWVRIFSSMRAVAPASSGSPPARRDLLKEAWPIAQGKRNLPRAARRLPSNPTRKPAPGRSAPPPSGDPAGCRASITAGAARRSSPVKLVVAVLDKCGDLFGMGENLLFLEQLFLFIRSSRASNLFLSEKKECPCAAPVRRCSRQAAHCSSVSPAPGKVPPPLCWRQ